MTLDTGIIHGIEVVNRLKLGSIGLRARSCAAFNKRWLPSANLRCARPEDRSRKCDGMNAMKGEVTLPDKVGAITAEAPAKNGWENKMAGLEPIRKEISLQLKEVSLEQNDADALNAEFELSVLISGR